MAKISETKREVVYSLELSEEELHILIAVLANTNGVSEPVGPVVQRLYNTLDEAVGGYSNHIYRMTDGDTVVPR